MSAAVGELRGYRPSEIATALFAALSVLVWSVVLLSLSALGKEAAVASIGVPDEVPIEVKPVLDLDSPLLKGKGGKKYRAKVPKEWAAEPPPRPEDDSAKTHVSTKSKDDVESIPDAGQDLADADPDKKEDAGEKGAGGAAPDDGDSAGTGEGGSPGSPDGQENPEDPLKALAFTRYRAANIAHFKAGFVCSPDVPAEVRASCVASAVFNMSGDGTVTSVSFSPCGDAGVDGPARATAESKRGTQAPPTPEKYPEFFSPVLSVTYRCPAK
jgi:hypothetical protein